jgi:hypothetical protein
LEQPRGRRRARRAARACIERDRRIIGASKAPRALKAGGGGGTAGAGAGASKAGAAGAAGLVVVVGGGAAEEAGTGAEDDDEAEDAAAAAAAARASWARVWGGAMVLSCSCIVKGSSKLQDLQLSTLFTLFTGFVYFTYLMIFTFQRVLMCLRVCTGLFTGLLWSLHTHSQLGVHRPRKPTPGGKRTRTQHGPG